MSTPNGLLEYLPSSFNNPFIPLTQSQKTNLFIFILSQEKLTSFSNLYSSLVLIQINEVLDLMSNSKSLHQEFIMKDSDYFLLLGSKGNLLSEIVEAEVVITSFLANNC